MATATIAKERPILFSGDMVRAILDGRKTQTRRFAKPQPEQSGAIHGKPAWRWPTKRSEAGYVHTGFEALERIMLDECPYGQIGDRLWVRETWQFFGADKFLNRQEKSNVVYRATNDLTHWTPYQWRPSIFMPRWACRIELEIVSRSLVALQDINEHDAEAEGLYRGAARRHLWWRSPGHCRLVEPYRDHKLAFADLWDEINFKRAPWSQNPLVWRIQFKVCAPEA